MPWSFAPVTYGIARLLGRVALSLGDLPAESWVVSPAEPSETIRCFYLPGQLDRVTGTEFAGPEFPRDLPGGLPITHSATMGYRLKDVWLVNGALYHGRERRFLHRPVDRVSLRVDDEVASAEWYSDFPGFRYFGQWLIDDCVAHELTEGRPTANTDLPCSPHQAAYENLLSIRPQRYRNAWFRELTVYTDYGQNTSKQRRWRQVRDRLRRQFPAGKHPGVFLLRGTSGSTRILADERKVAEELARRRGLRVIDPMALSVPEILQACAGAEVVAGVEGSHLVHGLMVMEAAGSVLTIMPPNRFGTILKDVAHRTGSQFGFVVGTPAAQGFSASTDEIVRTLDLMQEGTR